MAHDLIQLVHVTAFVTNNLLQVELAFSPVLSARDPDHQNNVTVAVCYRRLEAVLDPYTVFDSHPRVLPAVSLHEVKDSHIQTAVELFDCIKDKTTSDNVYYLRGILAVLIEELLDHPRNLLRTGRFVPVNSHRFGCHQSAEPLRNIGVTNCVYVVLAQGFEVAVILHILGNESNWILFESRWC